jgi:hypothetical protein
VLAVNSDCNRFKLEVKERINTKTLPKAVIIEEKNLAQHKKVAMDIIEHDPSVPDSRRQ